MREKTFVIIYIIVAVTILTICFLAFKIQEDTWHEKNPNCKRIKMCMNNVCEVKDENMICVENDSTIVLRNDVQDMKDEEKGK